MSHRPADDASPPKTAAAPAWLALAAALGVFALGTVWLLRPSPPPPAAPSRTPSASDEARTADRTAARAAAWARALPRLKEADGASAGEIDVSLAGLDEFFAERMKATKPFAKAILSLQGKWESVRSRLPYADSDAHYQFLREQFEANVFGPDDLRAALEGCVARYVSRLQGIENRLPVAVRQDLSDDLLLKEALPAARSDALLREEYQKMLGQVVTIVVGDSDVEVAQQVVSLAASEVAAKIALRVATAVAARLGASAGILGVGVGSSWVTLGVGVVAAVVVDLALDWVLKVAGYDPEGQVAQKVDQTLERVKDLLRDGNQEAAEAYAQLRRMEKDDPVGALRAQCRKAADRIERSGNLGLRHELRKLHEGRAQVRSEALRKLILEGGRP